MLSVLSRLHTPEDEVNYVGNKDSEEICGSVKRLGDL